MLCERTNAAEARWRAADNAFRRGFQQLPPGMNVRKVRKERVKGNRGKADRMEAEREALAEALRERGADLEAAMPALLGPDSKGLNNTILNIGQCQIPRRRGQLLAKGEMLNTAIRC